MNQNLKVLFFLKKGKGFLKGPLPIYVRITINGKRTEWSVQRQWESQKWIQKLGRASGTKLEAAELNNYLDIVHGSIYNVQKEYALSNEQISSGQVKAKLLQRQSERKHKIIEVIIYHNEQFAKLVGSEYSSGTFKKFKTALSSLRNFIKWKYDKDDLSISEINHLFITEYEFFLKSIQKLQHNSAMSNMKKLKKIVRQCVANEWLNIDPFKSYKITTRETNRNFLLKNELDLLVRKDINIPRLDQVRDIFVFSCYTGLSYSDVVNLTEQYISTGIDGEKWIFTNRIKTNTSCRIPILPVAQAVIEKYKDNIKVKITKRILPNISNERLNSYLKEIAVLCEFNKVLTFHCARHTFATTVTLTNGVPLETVGKMLGHKNLRTTQIYAKILDSKVSEDMNRLRNKLSDLSDGQSKK
jgi:site-specific recombinase XerD